MDLNISISQLASLDNDELKDIEVLLIQLNPDFVPPANKSNILKAISNPFTHILVARDGDKIIGMVTICTTTQIGGAIKVWIEDFVVDESFRSNGIGTKLIQAAHKKSKELGYESANLTSRPGRVVANKYYNKIGYKKRTTNVYKIYL